MKTPSLKKLAALFLLTVAASSCTAAPKEKLPIPDTAKKVVVAAGCFWCVEEIYEAQDGVYEAISGFAGGTEVDPTYEEVASGATSHTEAVEIIYDPEKIDLERILQLFWASFDATDGSGVAPDFGSQYRPELFYTTDEEKTVFTKSKAAETETLGKPVEVAITELETFYPASEYHQDFVERNPYHPYVKGVSKPRAEKTFKKVP